MRLPIFMALLNYLYADHLICPAHLCKELGAVAARFKLPRFFSFYFSFSLFFLSLVYHLADIIYRLASLCKRADYRAWARFGEAAPVILPSTFTAEMSQMVNNRDYSDLEFRVPSSFPLSLPPLCPPFF